MTSSEASVSWASRILRFVRNGAQEKSPHQDNYKDDLVAFLKDIAALQNVSDRDSLSHSV